MEESSPRRWAAVTAVAGTVFIAAGAFWLSFTSLADLAARSGIGAGQAWAWPLIVDGIIVVATVAVVALAGQRSAWYPWALLIGGALVSVTANAIHAVVAADADVPGILAASVAAVPPVVLLAITHLTVILTRAPASEPNAPDLPALAVATGAEPGQTPPLTDAESLLELTSEPAAADSLDPADRRAMGWELHDAGWSNKRIARELGVHPSTVGRWFAPAHLTTDITESADQREETTP
ncbi:Homeodomain-like domain-containing protein [Ruaniaceae bacterium KH17]|nr:Homeodomain-like domain-containing protein [Ruaniaceae bacterium KH17]